MNIEYIKIVIDQLNNSNIEIFEYSDNEISLKIDKNDAILKSSTINSINHEITCIRQKKIKIKSEYVGRAILFNNKTCKSFVTLGQLINKGDVLCIIDFLNIPINIVSPCSGIVSNIYIQDKTIVDYGKILFEITC
ncbi:acetyl-CoA carboxylase biotin carboxyl carrier protein subunit [Clostridium botulinum]|nr:acetyl-CoA carboxylase biotin carboxyl carrier protein subunit [Clostridium botulinum]